MKLGNKCCCPEDFDIVLETAQKRLKSLTENIMIDFGDGLAPAHRHVNGGGWVADTAIVHDSVFVGEQARIGGSAYVFENAHIAGRALINGRATVGGSAFIFQHAVITDQAEVRGDAEVKGHAVISGTALVGDSVTVTCDVTLTEGDYLGKSYIENNDQVFVKLTRLHLVTITDRETVTRSIKTDELKIA